MVDCKADDKGYADDVIKHNLSNYLQTDIELNVCSESIKVDLKKTKSVAQMFPPLKPAVPHTKY